MIEVEEEGTTAAAATAIIMTKRSMIRRPRVTQFIVDRPFLFFLCDLETGMLLFQGRIVDPNNGA